MANRGLKISRGPNTIRRLGGDMAAIVVISARHGELEVLLDEGDIGLVSSYHWHVDLRRRVRPEAKKNRSADVDDVFYAATNILDTERGHGRCRLLLLHRLIAGVVDQPRTVVVDHRNRNGLDNRRGNLLVTDASKNGQNNLARGYYFHKQTQKWMARITVDRATIFLGNFRSETEAAQAYRFAKATYHPTATAYLIGGA